MPIAITWMNHSHSYYNAIKLASFPGLPRFFVVVVVVVVVIVVVLRFVYNLPHTLCILKNKNLYQTSADSPFSRYYVDTDN